MSVLGAIGIALMGKTHDVQKDTGWEPFTNEIPEPEPEFDPKLAQEWAQIIRVAKKNGVKVSFTEKGISMTHGKSKGLFKDARGGLNMAKEFLSDFM